MFDWLQRLLVRRPRDVAPIPPVSPEAAAYVVSHDEATINLAEPGGATRALAWDDLGAVAIHTTDAGPFAPDLFWIMTSKDGDTGPVVPMGATGEPELLKAMQARLTGFDNMAVVEAMSSTEDATFLVWDHERKAPV